MSRVGMVGFVLLSLIIFSSAAQAEIYKWIDENGKVHYSDRKVSTQAQKINVKTGSSVKNETQPIQSAKAETSIEQRLLEKQKYVSFLQSERLERQEKRKQAQAEKEKQRKLCAAMQDKLKNYTQGNFRWYELDEKTGERIFISDDQIELRKSNLKKDIQSNC